MKFHRVLQIMKQTLYIALPTNLKTTLLHYSWLCKSNTLLYFLQQFSLSPESYFVEFPSVPLQQAVSAFQQFLFILLVTSVSYISLVSVCLPRKGRCSCLFSLFVAPFYRDPSLLSVFYCYACLLRVIFSLFLNPFVDLLSLVSLLQAKHTFSFTVLFSSPFATFHYSYLLLLLFCSLSLFPLFSPYFPNHHPILLLCFFFSDILHFLHCSLSNLAALGCLYALLPFPSECMHRTHKPY